ncbi:MAG TPA: ABC transporter substrate-binding protein [Limnochordales bacterium]
MSSLRSKATLTLACVLALLVAALPVAAQQAPVRIGALFPMTGDLSAFGEPFYNSALLAVTQINEQGGLLGGRPLELVLADSQTNPTQGVAAAQRLVNVERVPAIVGAAASGVTIPVATSVTVPNQVVLISPASTSPLVTTLEDNGFVFRTVVSDAMQGITLAKLAADLGYRRVATIYVNSPYGLGLAQAFETNFRQHGGTVTANVPFEQNQASYRGELDQASRGNPEALLLIAYPENGITILRQAIEGAYFDKFLFTDGMQAPDIIEAIGDALEGSWGTAPRSAATPATELFNAFYTARFGEPPPMPFMYESYDAVFALALAIEKAGEATGPAIRDALRDVVNPPGEMILPGEWAKAVNLLRAGQDIQYVGASGPVDFDANGDVAVASIGIWTIRNGQIEFVRFEEARAEGF